MSSMAIPFLLMNIADSKKHFISKTDYEIDYSLALLREVLLISEIQ